VNTTQNASEELPWLKDLFDFLRLENVREYFIIQRAEASLEQAKLKCQEMLSVSKAGDCWLLDSEGNPFSGVHTLQTAEFLNVSELWAEKTVFVVIRSLEEPRTVYIFDIVKESAGASSAKGA
jgi:hypothetical protein